MYIVPYIMHCHNCNSMSLQHGFFTFSCNRCEIIRGKDLDLEGVCPKCKLSDFFMLVSTSIDCHNCNASELHIQHNYLDYCDSLIKHRKWSKIHPIDLGELCQEAFKPSRIVYQYLIDPNYYEW